MRTHTFLLAVGLLACSLSSAAEEITLRVTDPQNGVVAGAAIEIRGMSARGGTLSGVTDEHGILQVKAELPIEVRVSAAGFDPLRQKVERNSTEGLNLQLTPATIHTTIDVVVRAYSRRKRPLSRQHCRLTEGARGPYLTPWRSWCPAPT